PLRRSRARTHTLLLVAEGSEHRGRVGRAHDPRAAPPVAQQARYGREELQMRPRGVCRGGEHEEEVQRQPPPRDRARGPAVAVKGELGLAPSPARTSVPIWLTASSPRSSPG